MKITYVGRHTGGVFLPGDVYVAHNGTVDVADELGAELCARADWKPAKKSPTPDAPTEENT